MFGHIQTDNWNLTGPPALLAGIHADAERTNTNLNLYLNGARTISSHVLYARSIDEFVDHYQDDRVLVLLAKMGICAAILEKEKSSNLVRTKGNLSNVDHEFLDRNDVWLKQLWYMMRQEVPRGRPVGLFENLSFVNFNYDRTLEAFLIRALTDMYDMPADEAVRFVENCPIYHPYGVVDRLSSTPFGAGYPVDLLRLKDNIRTYAESEASPQKRDYEDHLSKASNVVFLGFAYRQLNLELLRSGGKGSQRVFGTAVGIPEENFGGVEMRLSHVLLRTNGNLDVRLRPVKCAELLRLNEESLIS